MKCINKICRNITDYLAKELNMDNEKREVVEYGIFAIIQMIINIMCVIFMGIIFDVVFEGLIISFVVSILRKSSGGVHANSPEKCVIIGTAFSICLALIFKSINLKFNYVCIIVFFVFIWACYYVYKLAPVDSKSKPIKSLKKKKRLKNTSLVILCLYLLIVCCGLLAFVILKKTYILCYILCICGGIVWQVFSLTKFGHTILNRLN